MKQQFRYFIIFLCLSLFSTVCCYAYCCEQGQHGNISTRMYVNIQEIVSNEEGLFLIDVDDLIPLKSIAIDDFGCFVETMFRGDKIRPQDNPTCMNGHPVYHLKRYGGCDGCAHPWCIFRCKCHSPWL